MINEIWKPTPEAINDLPKPIRDYIHDLETNCDPAHEVRRRVIAEDEVAALIQKMTIEDPVVNLVARWRKEADQYQKHVDEARKAGTPHDQMLAMATALRDCAKELEKSLNL